MQHYNIKAIQSCFRLQPVAHYTLIAMYSMIMVLGVVGNAAILIAFLTNKVSRVTCCRMISW